MRMHRGRLLAALVTGAALSLFTNGVASATVAKCDNGTCIKVIGKGLHASDVMISEQFGHVRSGYYFAKVRYGGGNIEWNWTDWQNGAYVIYMKGLSSRNYPDGAMMCAGVERTQEPLDYPDEVCIKIHK
ncbi:MULTISPECIES: hypothetical protein [Streptomyces]|uniref:Streptomyces killer toxin-like beta/gamma crystallin domain-containing protein n=1 Tax=Streptomyces griseocarneus TaxID=51201 RepID=A0ABX7RM20_9ACTN|nr:MULTISPECIES: hypothetical protein [Streptomyces]QSY49309.1 hypothetical protein J3S04_30955 [Streptomyces griseocarneus]